MRAGLSTKILGGERTVNRKPRQDIKAADCLRFPVYDLEMPAVARPGLVMVDTLSLDRR